jgi:ABC-type cobalamin/Fe3+-siderophores transport system ATPase subunit
VNSDDGIVPPPGRPTVLAVNRLTKQFGERSAVSEVSFELLAGEVFGLLGPNGAGKTTTVRETIMREGDRGDLFYLVGEGQLDVSVEGCHVATLSPAAPVGEIVLLRDGHRTATIVANTNVELYALTREDFLTLVTSHESSAHAAERMIATRIIELKDILGRSA